MAKTKNDETTVTIPAPDGFALPDGTKPGEPFTATVTLQQADDGKLEILELDGLPVSNAPESDADEAGESDEPDDDDAPGAPAGVPPSAPVKRAPRPMSKIVRSRFVKLMGAKK